MMFSIRRRVRAAMTLVELLVVIAIIGTLMGLLLPAVQRVREAANRTSCRNNLKQIGIALHLFQQVNEHFPPGYFCESFDLVEVEFASPGWGWGAYILPYLDQVPLYEMLQWNLAVDDPPNEAPRTKTVKTFVCPSDFDTGVFTVLNQFNLKIGFAATNSYAACYGYGGDVGEAAGYGNGVFYRSSRTRMADIRDGASTTLAIGERAAWMCQAPWVGALSFGTVRTNPHSPTLLAAIEEAPVMALARTIDGPLNNPYSSPYDFYSPHPGTGQFLFVDGSVRSMSFQVSAEVWKAIGTRNGGETVSESDF